MRPALVGVVFATAPTDERTPAATLPLDDVAPLRRMVEQLVSLGVTTVHVVTRPGCREQCESVLAGHPGTTVTESGSISDDLRQVCELASRSAGAGMVLALGDVVTSREAIAGLLRDPRVRTGALTGGARLARPWAPRTRSVRGRIVSAASGYHSVRSPTGHFLGVLKVAASDVPALAAATGELAVLASDPPASWDEVTEARVRRWTRRMAARARREQGLEPRDPDDETPDDLAQLDAAADAELRRRVRALREDVVSLCLVGLVRSGVPVTNGYLRKFFWARPLDRAAASAAAFDLTTYDEDRLALDSAVKSADGFFTTFLVSPYSRYIARWAARHGWTPNGVTTLSMALGVVAAAAFAQGSRTGLVVGALMLQAAFTFDCVDGQLARYTRTFSALGAWLDSVFDRGKEYLVFAGLALGSTRGFDDDVWLLAVAAIVLQTVRHSVDFSYAAGQHHVIASVPLVPLAQGRDRMVTTVDEPREPDAADPEAGGGLDDATEDPAPPTPQTRQSPAVWVGKRAVRLSRTAERSPALRWAKRIFVLPIGERFAIISLTAAFFSPRVTFTVLLTWGGLAAAYSLTGKVLRSVSR